MAEGSGSHDQPPARRPPQVLLVDDNPLGRKLAAVELRHAGFAVTVASSGEEALTIARRDRPDAILSDIRMTGMSGFELYEAVQHELGEIPFFLLSSAFEEHDLQQALARGLTGFPRTPDLREALDALTAALRPSGPTGTS